MLLEVNGKIAIMIENKKILQTKDNQEIERIEICTYDIDNVIKTFTDDIKNKKDFLQLIYPLICGHIQLNQYKTKILTLLYVYNLKHLITIIIIQKHVVPFFLLSQMEILGIVM